MSEFPLFELRSEPLDVAGLAASLGDASGGALVTFEGRVRNTNEGRPVVGLEYDAYPQLCVTEGTSVVRGAQEGVLAARCVHRVGKLAVGEVAVWVGVVAGHREEAFRACRYIIDEVKRRVPIWKKELYADQTAAWIGAANAPADAPAGLGSLVLAGGASERMGLDKARLVYEGEPQVQRIARLLERVAPPVYVSVRPSQAKDKVFRGLRLLPDEEGGIGPLEGILRAFREAPSRAWLVVAVDMPFLTEPVLRRLVESRDPERHATAYRNPEIDGPEPVCAIYEPAMLSVLQERKSRGRYSLQMLRDLPVKLVEPLDPAELRNINSLEEYRRAAGPRPG